MGLITTMLESVATIYRAQISRDSNQGVVQNFIVIASNIPCTIDENPSGGNVLYAQRQEESSVTLIFYGNPGCQVNDVVSIVDRDSIASWCQIASGAKPSGRIPIRRFDAKFISPPNGLVPTGITTG